MVVDSRSFWRIMVLILWLKMLVTFLFILDKLLLFFPLVGMIYGYFQLKDRYYVGVNVVQFSLVIDLFFLWIYNVHYSVIVVSVFNLVTFSIFHYLVKREAALIKRPIFDLNEDEAGRARIAMKTRLPADIAAIPKLRSWTERSD